MKNRMPRSTARWAVILWVTALGLALAPTPAPAADTAATTGTVATTGTAATAAAGTGGRLRATGRRLAKELQPAIVNVKVVLSQQFSMGGQNAPESEMTVEASGTVIGPDGLTLIPLSAIDPSQLLARLARGQNVNLHSRVKDIKIIRNKRDEVPANVVLRDSDLNIAFLRPKQKPAQPWKNINLNDSAQPRLLEQVLVLARLGRIADREISVMTGEIQALVNKPRRFYVPSSELATGGLGVPIFTAAGKVVGIVLMRTMLGGDAGDMMSGALSLSNSQSGMLVVILPAKDVQEVAVQAPQEAEHESAAPAPGAGTAQTTGTKPRHDGAATTGAASSH